MKLPLDRQIRHVYIHSMLTQKQKAYIAGISNGLTEKQAALAAGSKGPAIFVKNPHVLAALAEVQSRAQDLAVYDTARCMAEALDAMAFAREMENPGAVVRAVELRARLSDLLIDRVEVVHLDLRAALERATARFRNASTIINSERSEHPSIQHLGEQSERPVTGSILMAQHSDDEGGSGTAGGSA